MRKLGHCSLLGCASLLALIAIASAAGPRPALNAISHIVVLYLENHSFDNLLGDFPAANNLTRAGRSAIQRDRNGIPYAVLPRPEGPFDADGNPADVRAITMPELPNKPFAIDGVNASVTIRTITRGLTHLFYTNRAQINGGANDRFALLSDAGGLTMGYYSASAMEHTNLWKAAREGVLFDHFFQGGFGGSFFNHMWLVCACAPVWANPPPDQRSILDPEGIPVDERRVTVGSDGDYVINTIQSVFLNDGKQKGALLPAQTAITIGDRLSERGIDWAWYSEGWNLALDQQRTPEQERQLADMLFAYHHQPFAYFRRFDPSTASGRADRRRHLRDAHDFEVDVRSGQLPPVAFYKPADINSEHPGLGSVAAGDAVIGRLRAMLDNSVIRNSYALIITYDEFGGFFDHVSPPSGPSAGGTADFFGPGSRVPAILASPLIEPGAINSTGFDTTSIAKFIAERFNLDPLPTTRFHAVRSLGELFDKE
jgi:phospholipase C